MSERFWIRNASVHVSLLEPPPTALAASDDGFARVDLEIAGGRLATVRARDVAGAAPGDIDMREGQVWPCFVDLHAHLDKGHIWPRRPNPTGSRPSALAAVSADREACWSRVDVRRRMEFGLRCAWAHGTRAIRSHLDSHWSRPDENWAAAMDARQAWADRVALELVGFAPLALFAGPAGDALADRVARAGGVLGAVVHAVTADLDGHLDRLLALAGERELDLDLHCDESSEAASFTLPRVAAAVLRAGFSRQVVCGHCTALTLQTSADAEAALELVERAGLAIVTLPLTNLFLQDCRPGRTPRWRGVTLVHELDARGIAVAVGGDNCRDPFYAFGDHDMLEVFREAVRIAHLDRPYGRWPRAVTTTPARLMRLGDDGGIGVGRPADLVLFGARDFSELLARPQADRRVLRAGVPIDTTLPDYRELDDLVRRC
jgi:cytosine/creatinine deaminase